MQSILALITNYQQNEFDNKKALGQPLLQTTKAPPPLKPGYTYKWKLNLD